MGVRFEGHPNLKRLLLWEGFHGHPLRKDWQEAYYEEEKKPFGSRWPNGDYAPAEERTPLGRNVRYPEGWDPDEWEEPDVELPNVAAAEALDVSTLKSDQIVVNFGPQHPSTHGVFRMKVALDGETVVGVQPVIGYLHRCHEKIGERNLYIGNIPFTDRLDYICSMANNLGYVLTVEKLLGVTPPPRAEYLRVIMTEFTRIVNHLIATGFLFNDLGLFFTASVYGIRERELILDVFEAVSGSRMMCNYMRFGGVAHDLTPEAEALARDLVFERLPATVDEFERFLTDQDIFTARAVGVGMLSPQEAIAHGVSGPMLRASGVPHDLRKAQPYSIYDQFDFDVITGAHGDVFDRYMVRIQEMRESIRILRQALNGLPDGEIQTGKKNWQMKVPAGEYYGRVENPKGELGFYVVSDGSVNPYRYHVRSPSLINLGTLEAMSVGHKIADLVVILGSVDITLGEVDR
ncbi:MAG: NADH-quinone oxidoreductase subunit D [Chloroflexi bacterium]|nr:NADH-quinone oxidoreductase subunit D [Chloroflexota bacterium]